MKVFQQVIIFNIPFKILYVYFVVYAKLHKNSTIRGYLVLHPCMQCASR